MDPDSLRPAKFQFTIGRAMSAIAGVALVLSMIRFGTNAGMLIAAILSCYALYRFAEIRRVLMVVAGVAVLVSAIRFVLALEIMFALVLWYCFLCYVVIPGPPLPRRRLVAKPVLPKDLS
jgi:hypothetical protein